MKNMNKLEANIKGRHHAEDILAFLHATLSGLPEMSHRSFWDTIRKAIPPDPSSQHTVKHVGVPVMTDDEAAAYEKELCKMSAHSGRPMGEVPIGFLVAVGEHGRRLSAYLRSERGQRRQEEHFKRREDDHQFG